jgi:hypothetical protein
MAIHLPPTLEIADDDEQQPCRFCGDPSPADPDDMERWTSHLTVWHGYRVVQDRPRTGSQPRVVRLELVGWSGEAEFEANQRVTVKPDSSWDYAGRRGTIVGWHTRTSEYAVAFDHEPTLGVLPSKNLEAYQPDTD